MQWFLAEIVGDPSCAVKPEDALKTNFIALTQWLIYALT